MATCFKLVSGDFDSRGQSWKYAAVWTYTSDDEDGTVRVEVKANAYENQSFATVSTWSESNGWNFHTGLPPRDWWDLAPSYVQKPSEWGEDERSTWVDLEERLLRRLAEALLGNTLEEVAFEVPGLHPAFAYGAENTR